MNRLQKLAIAAALGTAGTLALAQATGSRGGMGAGSSGPGGTPSTQTAPNPSDDAVAAKPPPERMPQRRDEMNSGKNTSSTMPGDDSMTSDASTSKDSGMTAPSQADTPNPATDNRSSRARGNSNGG